MDLLAAQELALKLMREFDLLPNWTFEFDNARRRFGCCHRNRNYGIEGGGRITLSRELVLRNEQPQVEDVIRHEIAHALLPPKKGHGAEWKAMCKVTGANPERCYDSEEVDTVEGDYVATCAGCGTKYNRFRRPRGEWWCSDKNCRRQHGDRQDIQKLEFRHKDAPVPVTFHTASDEAKKAAIAHMKQMLAQQEKKQ